MAILNYTTKVSVNQTLAEVHKILAKAGASAIMSEYDGECEVSAISFRVEDTRGPIHYKLPIDVAGVSAALSADNCYRDEAHARRVAWRIVKDWIESQMALVQAQMASLNQVFLPYAKTNTGETVYERFQSNDFKLLTGGQDGSD